MQPEMAQTKRCDGKMAYETQIASTGPPQCGLHPERRRIRTPAFLGHVNMGEGMRGFSDGARILVGRRSLRLAPTTR